jgi:hypothetical protein
MLELGKELIGGVALGFFWIHTLLIAAAAWLDFRGLGRLARGRVRAGVVRSGRGAEGSLARNIVEQIGRSKGDGVVHFNDAAHRSELLGGVIELDDGDALELEPGSEVPVWPSVEQRTAASELESPEQIERALIEARRARGWPRAVTVTITAGDRVFVIDGEAGPSVVSTVDPRRWITRRRGLIVGFILADLALASACTALILWPPLFDWISMLGAAAALGLFLAVQPIGVAVQDAVRTPDRAYLRGHWGP